MKLQKTPYLWIGLFLVLGVGFRVTSAVFNMPLSWRTWALLSLLGATTISCYVIVFQHLRKVFRGTPVRDIMNDFRELWYLLVDPERATSAYEVDDWDIDEK